MQITVNETGARTLADARPMRIDGQPVHVVVDSTASLFVGGRLVDVRRVSEVSNATEAQAWAVEYRDGLDAPVAVEEAVNTESVYAAAVAQIHATASEMLAGADELASFGEGDYRFRNSTGRMVTLHSSDPRHPARAAVTLRREADVLAAWTATDEQGYGQYVSDGIGDTDGYYAPVSRSQWKLFLSA